MHRPKKNKASDPTLPEDQRIDERNLIDLEDSSELSLEDKLHLYWVENKSMVSCAIVFLALLIIGFNGMRIYKEAAEAKLQDAYLEAKANGALESFALEYPNRNLGGFAALLVADEFYTMGNYSSAAEFYAKATAALDSDLLAARALLGESFAKYYGDNEGDGLAALNRIAADTSLPESIRLEAAYHLAVEADVKGESSTFDSYAKQITSSSASGQWKQRLELYRQSR